MEAGLGRISEIKISILTWIHKKDTSVVDILGFEACSVCACSMSFHKFHHFYNHIRKMGVMPCSNGVAGVCQ